MFEKQVTIGKRVSVTFLALLEVSVGAVREISRIALWQCQCLFTMQWIYVMYTTKKNICDVFIEMHEQWTKKYYGNHCTVQYCTVQVCFEIKHVMALFWNQGNRYACLGISECKMFVWSHAPVTFVDVLWSLFHLLTGTWLQDTCHLMPFTKYSLLDQSYFFTPYLSHYSPTIFYDYHPQSCLKNIFFALGPTVV